MGLVTLMTALVVLGLSPMPFCVHRVHIWSSEALSKLSFDSPILASLFPLRVWHFYLVWCVYFPLIVPPEITETGNLKTYFVFHQGSGCRGDLGLRGPLQPHEQNPGIQVGPHEQNPGVQVDLCWVCYFASKQSWFFCKCHVESSAPWVCGQGIVPAFCGCKRGDLDGLPWN